MTGKNPPAQYLPDVDNRKLEREALRNAEYIYIGEKGAVYFIYDAGRTVGYYKGKPAKWIRAELTRSDDPTFHGHPITEERAKRYIEDEELVLKRKK